MDTVLFFAWKKNSREENFAGGTFREIPFGVDIIFAGGKFRAQSKFANIAKISSTRTIGVIQYITLQRQLVSLHWIQLRQNLWE